jgi:RNA polymerase sigma-70 factor (ECF subfamily)
MTDNPRHDQFLRLFTANEPDLHAFVRSLLPTRDDAREVMQEVAVVLWRKFGTYATGEDFRKWAFGVARYEVLAYARDKARDRHVFDDDLLQTLAAESAAGVDVRELQREALERCLQNLPESQCELLLNAYAPGTRMDRLAHARGQTAMALYKLLHRLRLALIDCTRRELANQGRA